MTFEEAIRGFLAGNFSKLAPLFEKPTNGACCPVIKWFEEGLFANQQNVLLEAFTCACFNGCNEVVNYFLRTGIDPQGGMNTGLNAFHWAANRGHLETVNLLIGNRAPLEVRNSYGGTVLGCALWSAVHEPKPDHPAIIEALLRAGADRAACKFPPALE